MLFSIGSTRPILSNAKIAFPKKMASPEPSQATDLVLISQEADALDVVVDREVVVVVVLGLIVGLVGFLDVVVASEVLGMLARRWRFWDSMVVFTFGAVDEKVVGIVVLIVVVMAGTVVVWNVVAFPACDRHVGSICTDVPRWLMSKATTACVS
jgi:hypothetical protein